MYHELFPVQRLLVGTAHIHTHARPHILALWCCSFFIANSGNKNKYVI